MLHIPENVQIVTGTPIATTNGGITCDYISLKNAQRVWIVASLLQAATHTTALGVNQATAVLPSGAVAMTATFPIWKCADVSAGSLLTRGTDAASVLATAGVSNQMLVIEVDPATLTAGYDVIAATLDNSGEATNFASVIYLIEPRYGQVQPPEVITD